MIRTDVLSQKKILIIDDEPINMTVLEELLTIDGYSDICCEQDPVQAIQNYQSTVFDLVLLDLNMPEKSGFEVMAEFKRINLMHPPPILVLTASIDRQSKIRALTEGASDFLTKPFDHEEVLSRVHNLIKLRSSQQQLHLQNEVLEQKVQQRTKELSESKLDAIYRLGVVADYRDNDTAEHAKRVGHVSYILAQALKLDNDFCEKLRHAAPMHDIGKVGIPDSILLKPGKLDAEEWETIKKHSEMGAKILEGSPSDIIKMAHEIALTHHEKWDGTGYPVGLKGENIPISGRIVIVADVFDALNFDRPYKKAWPLEDIKRFMDEQRDIMFDSNVVDKFIEHFDEIVLVNQ
ncbi:MAG: response regulator [Methylophaga sp.]|nr:response regulator [Methylophaga sp.]